MTDTAKPTPNKGCTVKLWDRANFRYFVSDEAVDVYHETNLTPRQLLERVRELEAVRDDLLRTLSGIRDTFGTVHGKRLSLEHWSAIAQAFAQHADDALSKHGEKQ